MKYWNGLVVLACAGVLSFGIAQAQDNQFPLDNELILDVAPMRGSKRVPNMDVAANGAIALEMWCNLVEGQIVVAADTVTVLTGQATDRQCSPEQLRGDDELLAALAQVTNWRREGSTLVLVGPRTLRFRIPTN